MRIGKKAAIILRTIASTGPTSRQVALAPVTPPARSKNWGHSYFAPNPRGAGHTISLVLKGLIAPVAKQGNTVIYDLTEAGRAFIGA